MLSHLAKSPGRLTRIWLVVSWWLLFVGCCPKIIEFTPQSGEPGNEVTIRGSRFEDDAGENTVKFNGVVVPTSDISYASTTQIRAKVPQEATTGPISVSNRYCTGHSSTNFIVSKSFWSNDPSANTAICTSPREQLNPVLTSDNADGAIIAWYDWRGGTPRVYAQRINSTGAVVWAPNGLAICTASYNQYVPVVTSDGSGSAVIAWVDNRGGSGESDIYAQRINASGAVQWTANGVSVCAAQGRQNWPSGAPLSRKIVGAGGGGAIITWDDGRSPAHGIYAQYIDGAGVVQWLENGVAVSTRTDYGMGNSALVSGAGGVIITFQVGRIGSYETNDIYAQRVTAQGNL
jgi:hypothetical protein